MTTDNSLRDDVQAMLDSYAGEVDGYASKADKFRRLDRWTGNNPVLLVVDAAVTTTGLTNFGRAKPMAERFRDEFRFIADEEAVSPVNSRTRSTSSEGRRYSSSTIGKPEWTDCRGCEAGS